MSQVDQGPRPDHQGIQGTNSVDLVGSDPMEGVTRTSANEAVAAADAAAAAAIAVSENQRLEFER